MADSSTSSNGQFSLDEKYTLEKGAIIMSGIQALIRLPLDQHRSDKRQNLNTATLISGYRGSPLGGVDISLSLIPEMLQEHHVRFMPGVNEELAATAIMGSQLANWYPNPKYDGVLGMWYGKGPGVDRSGDAFKHANFAGTETNGGVLALCGDDPICKSSTLPHQSEYALYDARIPVLYPGSVQDILDLGLYGFALSRYTGLWVGMKIATDLADSFGTAQVSPDRISISLPNYEYKGKPWKHEVSPRLYGHFSLQMEKTLVYPRAEATRQFARINPINQIRVNPSDAWFGLVSAGKNYYDLRHALDQLGLDDKELSARGIRILKLGMTYPLEPEIIREFSKGLEEILVVEEKRPFIEDQLKSLIYNLPDRPVVVGKQDENGHELIPGDGELDADRLLPTLYKRLTRKLSPDVLGGRFDLLPKLNPEPMGENELFRSSFYCSGCPHNTSTVQVPEGSLAASGTGCSGLALGYPHTEGLTQMGGEGIQWAGAAPFSNTPHMFQNVGDGTFFHSGSLAIRHAVSADTKITFKLLYNAAVGMTGGQHADGSVPVPEVTRMLEAQGVTHIIVTAEDPDKYPKDAKWANSSILEIWHRDRIVEAQEKLKEMPGVTILIHDQGCAANLRRMRKRGKAVEPEQRIFINEAVCEGCGDCGKKSNCLSVVPVETEFGRKTQIHQSSCNKDYSCLRGDCPAFLTVIPQKKLQNSHKPLPQISADLPSVNCRFGESANIYMIGIGGTGVVTVNQILGTAALLDGKSVKGLDVTGVSQKGGSVTSHLKIYAQEPETSAKLASGEADVYIAFDILAAAQPQNLKYGHKGKTVGIVSTSKIATGEMVVIKNAQFPQLDGLRKKIEDHSSENDNVYVDAQSLSQQLFGSHMPANLLLIGAAYQAGCMPLSAESIERAIHINGVAIDKNIQAFRAGRKAMLDSKWVDSLLVHREGSIKYEPIDIDKLSSSISLNGLHKAPEDILKLMAIRVPELIDYQDRLYAQEYADFIYKVWKKDKAVVSGQTPLTEAVARYLYKLMAYKDEYEVARLHLKVTADQALEETFGKEVKVSYLLHPPILRAMGWKKKMKLGQWFRPFMRMLKWMKFLRGTPFDIFGYAAVRRTERSLIQEYKAQIETVLGKLDNTNYMHAIQLAELPDVILGYEEIKMDNVESYRKQTASIMKMLEGTMEEVEMMA